ncbi:MAG: TonB-dependent receptor [Ignavibacteriae bacterium]|nr:MAG: TonB-dependent receptor [Ignavibacteriota bacterium]
MNLRKLFFVKNSTGQKLRTLKFCILMGFLFQCLSIGRLHASLQVEEKKLEDVQVKMPGRDLSLEQAFQLIEQQSDFKFFYIKEEIPFGKIVNIIKEQESLYHVLQELGKEFSLAFNRVNNQIVVKKAAVQRPAAVVVQGTVCDASTNEPLAFASIVVDGTLQGTMTDANGKFTLTIAQDTSHLRCSYVGYKTEVIACSGRQGVPMLIRMVSIDMLLQDVTVYAHRIDESEQTEVSVLSLQSDNIKNITSAIPDVMRSIQMLPGVSTNNEFSAKFNVRGGNQDENLVLVNGTQVYDPFHIKEAPNASIGIFNVDMIKKMDLITGGFTARYGDRMSSVLNIDYREGNRDRIKGTASLSMTNFDAVVEGPIGEHGTFILGGRKSYLEYAIKMLQPDPDVNIGFYDVQGVVGYAVSPRQKLMLKFIHAGDDYSYLPIRKYQAPTTWTYYQNGYPVQNKQQWNDSAHSDANYYSSMVTLQSTNILSPSAILKSEISFYDQRDAENSYRGESGRWEALYMQNTYFYNYLSENFYRNHLRIQTLELNSTIDMQISSTYGIKSGLSYQHLKYDQDQVQRYFYDASWNNDNHFPDTTRQLTDNAYDNLFSKISTQSYKYSGFLENNIQWNEQVLVNIGGRFDYFDLNKDLTWSPRINVAYRTGMGMVVRAAWGYYYQSPIYRQIGSPIASDTNTQSERAIHTIVGIDYNFMTDPTDQHFLKLKIEGYRKQYDRLISAMQNGEGLVYYSRKNDATGNAWGIDGCLTYSGSGFYGWLSYGYLTSNQQLIHDTIGHSFPRSTDQRHTLAATGEIELGSRWLVNLRFVYGSGYAYTPSVAVFDKQKNFWVWQQSNPNSDYLPAYKRVDLRLTRDLEIFGKSTSVFLDVSNLFNFSNIQAYQYRFDNNGLPRREDAKLWSILPTLGMTVRF